MDQILTADGAGGTAWKSSANLMGLNLLGKLGIGTMAPAYDLHVIQSSAIGFTLERYGGTPGLQFRQADGTIATPVASRTTLGQLRFSGFGATTFSASKVALEIGAAETWSDTAWGQFLQFYTIEKGSRSANVKMRLSASGHVGMFGTTPTVSNCGTGATLSGAAADSNGTITEGTAATGCTLTFATPYFTAPTCTVTSRSGIGVSYAVAANGITITNVGAGVTAIDYICLGFGDSAGPT